LPVQKSPSGNLGGASMGGSSQIVQSCQRSRSWIHRDKEPPS
jgi:hypothetical protein